LELLFSKESMTIGWRIGLMPTENGLQAPRFGERVQTEEITDDATAGGTRLVVLFCFLLFLAFGCDFNAPFRIRVEEGLSRRMLVAPWAEVKESNGTPLSQVKVRVWFYGEPGDQESPDLVTETNNEGLVGPELPIMNRPGGEAGREYYIECRKKGYATVRGTVVFWGSAVDRAVLITMRRSTAAEH
jgi:hypothetical protein